MTSRYLAEFKTGAERKEAAENTMSAYKAAQVGSFVRFCLSIISFLQHLPFDMNLFIFHITL